jgi:hypothetical protein
MATGSNWPQSPPSNSTSSHSTSPLVDPSPVPPGGSSPLHAASKATAAKDPTVRILRTVATVGQCRGISLARSGHVTANVRRDTRARGLGGNRRSAGLS